MKAETIYANHVVDFLREIAPQLKAAIHKEQAERVDEAIKHYVFPLTSEFYGKAMVALRDTLDAASQALTPQQLDRARYLAEAIKTQWFSR